MFQTSVASYGEAITPREINHLRPEPCGDFLGVVRRACVYHDNLIRDLSGGCEAIGQVVLLVLGDEAQRYPRTRGSDYVGRCERGSMSVGSSVGVYRRYGS